LPPEELPLDLLDPLDPLLLPDDREGETLVPLLVERDGDE
jgi:hypothetical protein